MLSTEDISKLTELFREFSRQIRSGGGSVDDPMLTAIERAVVEIRKVSDAEPAATPPDVYKGMLWAAGKCIYDTSWSQLSKIEATWGITHHPGSVQTAPTIQRLAEVARTVPWPQYAPHALGAIRCQALMESKRDTADGYDRAWLFHRDAVKRYDGYKESLRGAEKTYIVGLDDTFIQLGLAETGTACRQAERIIGRWAEEFGKLDGSNIQDTWLQLLFNNLREGAEIGERTLATA